MEIRYELRKQWNRFVSLIGNDKQFDMNIPKYRYVSENVPLKELYQTFVCEIVFLRFELEGVPRHVQYELAMLKAPSIYKKCQRRYYQESVF